MSKTRKIPARKSNQPAAKKGSAPKSRAPKPDAGTPAETAAATPSAAKPRDPRLPAPGTTTTRTYKDKALKVTYLDEGVEVDGKRFDSLSAAARHVTGAASINGFLFFGLVQPKRRAGATAGAPRDAKSKKPVEPKVGDGNDIGTAAGQREALAAVGLAKKSAAKSTPSAKGATK